MNKPEALIVGINSFLGKAIYELIKDNYTVAGIYHKNVECVPGAVEAIPVSSIDNFRVRNFTTVYLVSAYVPAGGLQESDENLISGNILLPQKISSLFPQSRIIFCSSVSVYENAPAESLISNSDTTAPWSKYALSKLWGERIIEKHSSYAIIRISSMYGEGMKKTTFLPKIIESAIRNGTINLLGSGERRQNYIHVNDVAEIAVKAAGILANITLLAVSDKSYSNTDIAEIISEITLCEVTYSGNDASRSYLYNNSETHERLGRLDLKNIKEG